MQPKSTTDILLNSNPGMTSKGGEAQTSEQKDAIIRSKSRFINNMAYQIRTLSNAIIGFSDLLRQEELSESQREYVTEIFTSGQGLASLVNDVLDLSRLENGQLDVENTECSLAWLFDGLHALVHLSAEEKGLEFDVLPQTDLPVNIRTDPIRLRQCLSNLLGNAIKYTSKGHVYLNVSCERIKDKDYIRFDIEDTGIGISDDKIEAIFQPYAEIEAANESILQSLDHGLVVNSGLAVANQLVTLLDGTIAVASEVNEGTVFTLILPANVDITSEAKLEYHLPEPVVEEQVIQTGDKHCVGHILLVEDDPSNQTVISLLLETMGVETTLANDGLEGVKKGTSGQFDLILMDIKMPNMNGDEATKVLREKGVVTPIIAISAAGEPSTGEYDGFLAKPVDSDRLFKTISKFLPVGKAIDSEEIPEEGDEENEIETGCVVLNLTDDNEPGWDNTGK